MPAQDHRFATQALIVPAEEIGSADGIASVSARALAKSLQLEVRHEFGCREGGYPAGRCRKISMISLLRQIRHLSAP
jgi:hypothetical protein